MSSSASANVKIGTIEIKGKTVLAPMAGVTDLAYRSICAAMGAAYTVTEMVSSKALQHNHQKSEEIAVLDGNPRPCAIQIFGDDPTVLSLAAKKLLKYQPDAIDINMGCPVPKVAGNNSGSALMRNPDLCASIVASVKAATGIPVTVKIRKGWDEDHVNAVEVAKLCAQAGAAAIAVHGRTRSQMYTGIADLEIIKAVKAAVHIPVIGNGDVSDAGAAARMLEETGCDLVMIGRGALGNPWIFREINAFLCEDGTILPPPSLSERLLVIRRHITAMCENKGEKRAMQEARKHAAWYLHGMKHAAAFRRQAGTLSTLEDLDALLQSVYEHNYGQL